MTERETCAYVLKTNGAWLIRLVGEGTEDIPDNELYDAASSLVKAKRVAVEDARDLGHGGAIRWEDATGHGILWALEMTLLEE